MLIICQRITFFIDGETSLVICCVKLRPTSKLTCCGILWILVGGPILLDIPVRDPEKYLSLKPYVTKCPNSAQNVVGNLKSKI